jgi:hypothetical protein
VVALSLSPAPPPPGTHPPAVPPWYASPCHLVGSPAFSAACEEGEGEGEWRARGAAGGVEARSGMREGRHRVQDFYMRPQKI